MKKLILLFFLFFYKFDLFSQNGSSDNITNNYYIQKGIGLGNILAVTISWTRNKNILLAIFHGILGWIYVVYFAIIDLRNK